jgi:hypothetical protein
MHLARNLCVASRHDRLGCLDVLDRPRRAVSLMWGSSCAPGQSGYLEVV